MIKNIKMMSICLMFYMVGNIDAVLTYEEREYNFYFLHVMTNHLSLCLENLSGIKNIITILYC